MEKTKVINIKKGKCDIYIGRPSIFGNPYTIGRDGDRNEVVKQYKIYFYDRIEKDKDFKESISWLKGKKIGCYCYPLPCHGDIIVKYLEG